MIFSSAGAPLSGQTFADKHPKSNEDQKLPLVVSTWRNTAANEAAWEVLNNGRTALDAVETGTRVVEADPNDSSVGYGGRPDREGHVTLDACIMDHDLNCGSVAFLEDIKHPISVARKVMEETPHVMLAGEGARQFAVQQGFEKEDLLTEKSEKAWKDWLKESKYAPEINIEDHDTIGMLAIDKNGRLGGACTTSGLAYKMRGRVGDSPIIGAGLYVDGEVGAATATGMGEAIIRVAGAHLVVELMRNGMSPEGACKEAVQRVIKKVPGYKNLQTGFIAINNKGEVGAYALQKGFVYAIHDPNGPRVIGSPHAI